MVPLVGAIFAIAMTLGVMGLIIIVLPLSVFALNLVIALGLGLSVDFSLLIVSRFREELNRGAAVPAALVTVRRTAGHTVLVSSLTVAAAMATLAIFPSVLSTRWELLALSSCCRPARLHCWSSLRF